MEEQVLAVQRMQDYIAQHLNEELSLADLARISMFSPWYAHRLFKAHTGLAPAEYIRRLRLSQSALRLRGGGCKVVDVAFELGFGSADGYTRAFYRAFGVTPHEYAHSPLPLPLFVPYGVKFVKLRKEESEVKEVNSVFIQRVEKPCRKVVLKRGIKAKAYFDYCEEVGCDVWGMLTSMPFMCGEPVCLWLPERYRTPGTSCYVQGVEVASGEAFTVPEGFDVIELPAAQYLMFQGEPFAEEDYCEAIVQVQRAAGRYDPSVLGLEWDADNPRIQLEPVGTRGYIELYPVRPRRGSAHG